MWSCPRSARRDLLLPFSQGLQHRRRAAQLTGHVDGIACLCSRAQKRSAGRHFAGHYDIGGDQRRLRNIAPSQYDFKAPCQRQQPAQEPVNPALRELSRHSEREKCCPRLAAHGRNIAQTARQAAMPDAHRRVPLAPEVGAFDAEIGSDQQFAAARDVQYGAVIANPHGDSLASCRTGAANALNQFGFACRQGDMIAALLRRSCCWDFHAPPLAIDNVCTLQRRLRAGFPNHSRVFRK